MTNFSWNNTQSYELPENGVDPDDVGNGHEEEDEEEEEGGAVHPHRHCHHPAPPQNITYNLWIINSKTNKIFVLHILTSSALLFEYY